MGHQQSLMTPERQLRAQRAQQMSLIYTVMVCLVSLIFVQFLLLTVALEGYLSGSAEVALPQRWYPASAVLRRTGCSGIFLCQVGADHRHLNPPRRGGGDMLTLTVAAYRESGVYSPTLCRGDPAKLLEDLLTVCHSPCDFIQWFCRE